MRRIGILGGTFNPIHDAHLSMADAAMKIPARKTPLGEKVIDENRGDGHDSDNRFPQNRLLDEIWFMPSKHPPHKSEKQMASEVQRCEMIQLAIQEKPAYRLSKFELEYDGITYTAQTLLRLKQFYPKDHFSFIMGGDSFFQLESWYHPEEILKLATILAIARNGALPQQMEEQALHLKEKYQADIQIVEMPEMTISSSMIRERVGRGESIHGMLPEAVEEYIREQKLYRT